MSCYPDLAFCHYCFSHYCLVLVIPNEVRNLLFAGLASARCRATENLGCPVSRVFYEKWGTLASVISSSPVNIGIQKLIAEFAV